jgi:hypothetical protein
MSRRLVKVVLGALILLLPCLLMARSWRSEPISPAGFSRIRLGMTPSEVEAAIGLPAGDYYTRHQRYGATSGPFVEPLREVGIPRKVFTDAMRLRGEEPSEPLIPWMWCGNTYCIWVAFDERGTAVGAYLLKVVSDRDSTLTGLLDAVRFQLGL